MYPLIYENVQLYKTGFVKYFAQIWNYSDYLFIWSGFLNVIVQFVDLAGRESLGEEHGFCKTLSSERNHINTSLFHLSHCLSLTNKLAKNKFRYTKLTMLLSQTLNAATTD